MRVGIIGSGAVGGTLGKLWADAGHDVMYSSRHPEQLAALVAATGKGASAGTPGQATRFGSVVLLAVNYASVGDATTGIRDLVANKILIDATNPLVATGDGGTKRVIGDDDLAVLVMAARLPRARLVKAFTTMWTGYLEQHAHRHGKWAAVPFASDDAEAKVVVKQLIHDAGFQPVDLGGLADSRPLDPPSPIWNKVLTASEIWERLGRTAMPSAEAVPA